jgi:hypothetical protein
VLMGGNVLLDIEIQSITESPCPLCLSSHHSWCKAAQPGELSGILIYRASPLVQTTEFESERLGDYER